MADTVVLMYHALYGPTFPKERVPKEARSYAVAESAFRAQLGALKERHARVRSPADFPEGLPNEEELGIVITFDDGYASDVLIAKDMLQEHGFGALFFVTSDFLGTPGMLSEGDLKGLADAGFAVGAHGRTHRFFSTLGHDELREELTVSKKRLEDVTGRAVKHLALPGGRFHGDLVTLAEEAGYRAIFTSVPGINTGRDSLLFKRIAVKDGTDGASFAKIIAGDGRFIGKLVKKAKFLAGLKSILGDNIYAVLRDGFYGIFGGS